jgi:biotin operon repressor
MIYKRSQAIERRLELVLRLIRTGGYSTPSLSEKIGVSIPTISRCVNALRERGHEIRSERHSDGWRYVLPKKGATVKVEVEGKFAKVSK